jgi:Flp pilus assembly protein TadD
MLTPAVRTLIAKGLDLLGSACVHLGEIEQAEEVYRIGIQYAQDGAVAADLFRGLGQALLSNHRAGEAIGPLRRALAVGGPPQEVLPSLARAFLRRGRYVAAFSCFEDALASGVPEEDLAEDMREVEAMLGPALATWKAKRSA